MEKITQVLHVTSMYVLASYYVILYYIQHVHLYIFAQMVKRIYLV